MSEPVDLTSKVLEQIRDELRAHTTLMQEHSSILKQHSRQLGELKDEVTEVRDEVHVQNERQGVFETVLRDLAEQMVMLTRSVKVSIDSRTDVEARLAAHDSRIGALERRLASESG